MNISDSRVDFPFDKPIVTNSRTTPDDSTQQNTCNFHDFFPHHWNIEIRTMPTTTWLNLQLAGIRNHFWLKKSARIDYSLNGNGSKFNMIVAQECMFDATNDQNLWVH